MEQSANNIIEFYGENCPHCISIMPVVAQLEGEMGITVQKLEVWNNPHNHQVMEQYAELISSACGGYMAVPSFVNTTTKQVLCGAHDKDDLKILFSGGDCKDGICQDHTPIEQKK